MAGPPSKKRRIAVELSPGSEIESSPAPDSTTARSRPTTRNSSKATSFPTNGNNGLTSASRTVSAAIQPKQPKPPAPKASVKHKKDSTTQPKKNPPKSKSIRSFLSLADRTSSSVSTTASNSAKLPLSSQNENPDDLIEDISSDEEWRSRRLDSSSSQGNQLPPQIQNPPGAVKRINGSSLSRHHSIGLSNFSTASSSSSSKLRKPADPRPWAERFAPKTSSELAVHVKKIAEVRTWLENVLNKPTGKRLLILKGSSGTGKTATIDVLSKELGFEILEWRNPSTSSTNDTFGHDEAFSSGFSGIFEEFLSRAGKFGTLELGPTPSAKPTLTSSNSTVNSSSKKVILIEDFPNALFTFSSTPLASFRRAIKSFLAMARPSAPLPPLVLIISETTAVTGPDAFTAHRLLSPEIINHPLATAINFNKIAPTFMVKALNSIIAQESRDSGRKFGPSKAVLETLSSNGDIRSAIMGLEFLAVNGEQAGFLEKFAPQAKGKRKKAAGEEGLKQAEKEMLQSVTQRESNLGLFHAVGKVVHNKRYGDDPQDPYVPPPPRPPLPHQPFRNRTSRADPSMLMDEAGTDIQTLISGIHENYLPSCNLLGGLGRNPEACMEDIIECVNVCLESLSDSDMLASSRANANHWKLGGRMSSPNNTPSWGNEFDATNGGSANIRIDEISLHVAVRGTVLGLPTPVKREPRDNKMFYPMGLRLWRQQEEIEGAVESLLDVASRQDGNSKGKDELIGMARGMTQPEMVLERMPYIRTILKGRQDKAQRRWPRPPPQRGVNSFMRNLQKVTTFKGVGFQSDEVPDKDDDQEGRQMDELEAAEEPKGKESNKFAQNPKAAMEVWGNHGGMFLGEGVEKLFLSDDDIED
ncbi:RFC checkpoint protein Rad17 [Rhizina undulata]